MRHFEAELEVQEEVVKSVGFWLNSQGDPGRTMEPSWVWRQERRI